MSKNTYTAENGFVITDDIVDKWAEEAEDNFPGATITEFAGRAQEDETQPLKPRTVRLSDTVWHLIEADAKRRKMTVSAWTRNAILNELSTEIAAQRQLRKDSCTKVCNLEVCFQLLLLCKDSYAKQLCKNSRSFRNDACREDVA